MCVCVWVPVKYAWYVVKVFTRAGKLADIILLSACILISSPGQTPSKLLDLLVIIVRRDELIARVFVVELALYLYTSEDYY